MTFTGSDPRQRNVNAFIGFVVVLAIALTVVLTVIRLSYESHVNWIAFILFAVVLFIGENQPKLAMRFGDGGEVTPGWTFAYALMLLGSPLGAVAAMGLTNLFVDIRQHYRPQKIIFNFAQIVVSLSAGGVVLHFFDIHGAITRFDRIPIVQGIGILAGGCMVFLLNGLLTAIVIGLSTRTGFLDTLRAGFALSMTADGVLLSLAPVFVIAVDYSLVLLPLLGAASYFVFRSAKDALQRAHEANHDALTGLLNRRGFDDRLGKSLAGEGADRRAILVLMDFDRFKEINDRLGHQVGDSLLTSFAARLADLIPPTASAARLGGDEFAVVIPGHLHSLALRRSIEELHRDMTKPFDIDGFPLSIAVSIGVAVAPEHGGNPDDLLAAADLAMYRAKQFNTGVEHHVSNKPAAGGPGRIDLLADLATAISEGNLQPHYQPMIAMKTGKVDTVEALVRWRHHRHGLIQPTDFIGMAEQTDLIDPLTELMLRKSMQDVLALEQPEISLAVNVSPRSLHSRLFASTVINCAHEVGFPTARLELEITERALATDPERMALTIDRLRSEGVRIAIDDFGTGYSSLVTLRQLRADRLKIDKQFIRPICSSDEDQLVVRTITELAHGLGLSVIAEGVETDEVFAELGEMGCDLAQGYAIARPMPFADLTPWMSHWNATRAPTVFA